MPGPVGVAAGRARREWEYIAGKWSLERQQFALAESVGIAAGWEPAYRGFEEGIEFHNLCPKVLIRRSPEPYHKQEYIQRAECGRENPEEDIVDMKEDVVVGDVFASGVNLPRLLTDVGRPCSAATLVLVAPSFELAVWKLV